MLTRTSKKIVMPNFLIIGAAKAGTTALHYYLNQHPQIYTSPVKETKFFVFDGQTVDYQGPGDQQANREVITNIEAYREQFSGVSEEIAIGEASPLYLYHPRASERIHYYLPDVKLIAILRNPVDRAYSSFLHLIRDGREPLTNFAQALKEEESRINNNWALLWHYKNAGFYYPQLKRYFDRFSQSQIKIYLYEDLHNSPLKVLQDLFQFLEVDETFIPDMSTKYNVSRIPKNRVLHRFLTESHPVKSIFKPVMPETFRKTIVSNITNQNLGKPKLSPKIRSELLEIYREDLSKLENLIERDLTHWLN